MLKFLKKIETLLAAASFAEEGEFETARKIMKEEMPRKADRPSSYKHKRTPIRPTTRAD
jgi:hypothetical protein